MLEISANLQGAYASLCENGLQFPVTHTTIPLDGLTFAHPQRGEVPIRIDQQTLATQPNLYVGNTALRRGLAAHGIETTSRAVALTILGQHLNPRNNHRVWGFSGYATGGTDPHTGKPYSYEEEAAGLIALYDYLASRNTPPSIAFDGGVNAGFLALNSIVARSAHVQTVGFLPNQGLAAASFRDHMVVAGEIYEDRECAIATADILVCAGGDKGTMRECMRAVKDGAAALLLNLKAYPTTSFANNWRTYAALQAASKHGRLVECTSLAQIPACVDALLQVDSQSSRYRRLASMTQILTS